VLVAVATILVASLALATTLVAAALKATTPCLPLLAPTVPRIAMDQPCLGTTILVIRVVRICAAAVGTLGTFRSSVTRVCRDSVVIHRRIVPVTVVSVLRAVLSRHITSTLHQMLLRAGMNRTLVNAAIGMPPAHESSLPRSVVDPMVNAAAKKQTQIKIPPFSAPIPNHSRAILSA
jgi:hypothetical protein